MQKNPEFIEDPSELVSSDTITDSTIGSIIFSLYKNGMKSVRISEPSVSSSTYTSTSIIPSAYLPRNTYFVAGSTWVNAKYRRFSLISDGRIQLGPSDENGLTVIGYYM